MLPHAVHQHTGMDIPRIFFPCGADIGYQREICFLGTSEVFVEQPLDSAVCMGLHHGPKPSLAAQPCHGEHAAHFCGVMAVIMKQFHAIDGIR